MDDDKLRRGGQPGNLNGFKHGLAAIAKARTDGKLRGAGKQIAREVYQGLIKDVGGEENMTTTRRVLAQIIANDAGYYHAQNWAISKILKKNPNIKDNPAAMAKLDSYRRPVANALT